MGEVELFVANLTDPIAENVKASYFDLCPDLDLRHDLNISMLSMAYVRLNESPVNAGLMIVAVDMYIVLQNPYNNAKFMTKL